MGCYKACCSVILLCFLFGLGNGLSVDQSASLVVNASQAGRKIPETLFGQFFEEINHAGAGGLWAELVSNRGFEAGGQIIPSNIDPWTVIGNESSINVSTDQSSCFKNNKIALRVEVLCDKDGSNICPDEGVGIYNPGFWGMNIEDGKTYNAVFYVSSEGSIDLSVALTASNGTETLASSDIKSSNVSSWTKIEIQLKAKGGNPYSRLQITTTQKGVIWFDQVSLMPADTFKGHGFRKDLAQMMADLKPRFLRFPGGCFVEGEWLRNAFRWKATVGPWEERPGHFGDVWMYWTDDGLGYLEFLQLAEDLETEPVWVFNNGVSHNDQVDTSDVLPFVQEALDGLEFARGSPNSTWGSLRAKLGHPEPFDLKYVAVGNEDCGKKNYRGNYLKFYNAIRRDYPDIKIITNCDGSTEKLDHPADIYDYHIYTSASNMFSMTNYFDRTSREGPKAFISEYAVTEKNDIGNGTLLAALGEAGFLIGVEKNSDIVEMASYAPLFVNTNDRRWNPDAIVFDSSRAYGTPSYWMQQFFAESSGATLHDLKLNSSTSNVVASAISYKSSKDNQEYLKIKIVNFGSSIVNIKLSVEGYNMDSLKLSGIIKTVLTSGNVMDENSFQEPKKVTPVKSSFEFLDKKLEVSVDPNSLTSFDILKVSSHLSTMTRILPQDVHHKE